MNLIKKVFNKISAAFWSIYFVLTIGIIGFIFGYIISLSLYLLSFLLSRFNSLSITILHFAENFQCLCIRFLLSIQPWLNCSTNFPEVLKVYDKLGTRKVFFAANHRSNLDTFLLISYIPGLRGLAKKSLFYNLFIGVYMYLTGFIPIDKGDLKGFKIGMERVKKDIFDKNRSLLIFPETTRCQKNFCGMQKFVRSTFQVAIDSDALVVPIAIKNTDQVLGRGDLFLTPFKKIEIKMLEPISVSEFESAIDLSNHVWKNLNKEVLC